jgi:hypothetical protein
MRMNALLNGLPNNLSLRTLCGSRCEVNHCHRDFFGGEAMRLGCSRPDATRRDGPPARRHRLLKVSRQRDTGAGHRERVARRRADHLGVLRPINKADRWPCGGLARSRSIPANGGHPGPRALPTACHPATRGGLPFGPIASWPHHTYMPANISRAPCGSPYCKEIQLCRQRPLQLYNLQRRRAAYSAW